MLVHVKFALYWSLPQRDSSLNEHGLLQREASGVALADAPETSRSPATARRYAARTRYRPAAAPYRDNALFDGLCREPSSTVGGVLTGHAHHRARCRAISEYCNVPALRARSRRFVDRYPDCRPNRRACRGRRTCRAKGNRNRCTTRADPADAHARRSARRATVSIASRARRAWCRWPGRRPHWCWQSRQARTCRSPTPCSTDAVSG